MRTKLRRGDERWHRSLRTGVVRAHSGTFKALILCALATLNGCESGNLAPQFVDEVPWAFASRWMRIDMHLHSRFSDGAELISELGRAAREHGCHGIAITDHSDQGSGAASSEYFAAIAAERAAHEAPKIIAGLEWNVTPYAGREHISILVQPELEPVLAQFRKHHELKQASEAFAWLAGKRQAPHDIVAFYNHPSRRDFSLEENYNDYLSWTAERDLLIGFEGGPGHQRAEPRGNYSESLSTLEGWDPVVAQIGSVWDQLLDAGHAPWGALANSDFHDTSGDFAPCEFSRTHVLVPEVSENGILMGLRAGAFWAQMGPFLSALDFRISSPELLVPATVGESFRLGAAPILNVMVDLERLPAAAGQTIELELIGNTMGEPSVVARTSLTAQKNSHTWRIENPRLGRHGTSAYLRLRARTVSSHGTFHNAYTNPIRIYPPSEG